ncbi:MAG: hypothetical protein DRP09_20430 [Candidatus Thorarchaeota archaeon]|nr:MAG: hypothetical protein DRP09_20430 [Candidatus Thorarchaeota archaeon]
MAGFHHAFWGGAQAWVSTASMMMETNRYIGTAIVERRWEDAERGARGLTKEFATLATVPYRVQWEMAKGIVLSPFNILASAPGFVKAASECAQGEGREWDVVWHGVMLAGDVTALYGIGKVTGVVAKMNTAAENSLGISGLGEVSVPPEFAPPGRTGQYLNWDDPGAYFRMGVVDAAEVAQSTVYQYDPNELWGPGGEGLFGEGVVAGSPADEGAANWSAGPEFEYYGPPEGYPNKLRHHDGDLSRMEPGETLDQMMARRGFETDRGYRQPPIELMWGDSAKKQHVTQLLAEHGELVKYNYAIDAEGNVRMGQGGHHSYLVQGENVYGAGTVNFSRQGDIVRIDAKTGHYYYESYYHGMSFGEQFKGYLRNLLVERYGFIDLFDEVFRMSYGQ